MSKEIMHCYWYITIHILENAFNPNAILYEFKGIKCCYYCRMNSAHLYKSSSSSLSPSVLNISKVSIDIAILSSFYNHQFCIYLWSVVLILSSVSKLSTLLIWALGSSSLFLIITALYIISFKIVIGER